MSQCWPRTMDKHNEFERVIFCNNTLWLILTLCNLEIAVNTLTAADCQLHLFYDKHKCIASDAELRDSPKIIRP